MKRLRAGVLLAVLATASCGTPLMKLPTGPGEPAADTQAALAQATTRCARVSSLSAEVAVRGSVDGHRMRGRLLVGVAGTDGLYIEAPAPFGAPLFVLGATGGTATLLLPRDKRVVQHDSASDLLQALAGVPLDGPSLRSTLTGCAALAGPAGDARAVGRDWRVMGTSPTLYLHRDRVDAPWRLVSVQAQGAGGWRTDYSDFTDDGPHTVRLVSNTPRRFDLRLDLSQVDLEPHLDASTFRVTVPPGTQPMSLEELRGGGPIAR